MANNESYARAKADGLLQITAFVTREQKNKLRILAAYEDNTMQRVIGVLIDEFWRNNASRYIAEFNDIHGDEGKNATWPSI